MLNTQELADYIDTKFTIGHKLYSWEGEDWEEVSFKEIYEYIHSIKPYVTKGDIDDALAYLLFPRVINKLKKEMYYTSLEEVEDEPIHKGILKINPQSNDFVIFNFITEDNICLQCCDIIEETNIVYDGPKKGLNSPLGYLLLSLCEGKPFTEKALLKGEVYDLLDRINNQALQIEIVGDMDKGFEVLQF